MIVLGLASAIAYSLVSLILGVRLLLLHRRTRRLPELLVGVMFLSGGVLGYTMSWLPVPRGLSPLQRALWTGAGGAFVVGGCVAMLFAVWRIFRPNAPWAGVLVGAFIVMLVPFVAPRAFVGTALKDPRSYVWHPLVWGFWIASVGSYAWMAWESLRTQVRIRRQHRMGFGGDLAVATRLLLWGLGTGCKAVLFATTAVAATTAELMGSRFPVIHFVSVFGLACSACLWLAFFPPKGYFGSVDRRAA